MKTYINLPFVFAILLSGLILGSWWFFYQKPFIEKTQAYELQEKKLALINKITDASTSGRGNFGSTISADGFESIDRLVISRKDAVSETSSNRVFFENDLVRGSINLIGLKFDDLLLKKYKQSTNSSSENVYVLSPSNSSNVEFASFGFAGDGVTFPDKNTIWKVKPSTKNNIALYWVSPEGVNFEINVLLDDKYLFSVEQKVTNSTANAINSSTYGRILKGVDLESFKKNQISHEGFIVYANKVIKEVSYDDASEDLLSFDGQKSFWGGVLDKYWAVVLKSDGNTESLVKTSAVKNGGVDFFQIDYLSQRQSILPGASIATTSRLFAGPKEIKVLDGYKKSADFTLFDRVVDFGILYFLTKPILLGLTFINGVVGNFGFSIILLTLFIKIILFPIGNKSYESMAKMKRLSPEIQRIKESAGSDKMLLNKQIAALYKSQGVNPITGCLPMVMQIPIFFALYKVLFISIELRHAEFIFWLKDLSAQDPTSIFNLFGLLPFSVPDFLRIGVLPIIMGISMVLQQSLTPKPADKTQMNVMKFMPYVFTVIFASFPSGLLLYWIVNNFFSIFQQIYVEKFIVKNTKLTFRKTSE